MSQMQVSVKNRDMKLLFVGGCYDTAIYREIQKKRKAGKTIDQIAAEMKKSPLTIRSYLPIERVIYNLDNRSVNADRLVRFKERHGGYKAVSR